jgi:hypothetical protein
MAEQIEQAARKRVPLRWYAISLLAPLLILLIALTILYGLAPLRGLAQNWLLLFTAFLPALAIMIVLKMSPKRSVGPDSFSPGSKIVTAHCALRC